VLLACIAPGLSWGQDTLTRGEVHSYSVGDTFVYKTDSWAWIGPHTYSIILEVITGVTLSQTGDTLFAARLIDSSSIAVDTITPLNEFEVHHIDSAHAYLWSFSIDTASYYNGRTLNEAYFGTTDFGLKYKFVEGLGQVTYEMHYGNPLDGFGGFEKHLVYYSIDSGTEVWGHWPVLGIHSPQAKDIVSVGPTAFTGELSVIVSYPAEDVGFYVFDLLARPVLTTTLARGHSTVNMADHEPGVYLWIAYAEDHPVSRGKLILR
jgi:hypothetical protein